MAPRRRKTPDLFEDHLPDPVEAATGGRAAASGPRLQEERGPSEAGDGKRKAGFYLSEETLTRFNTCYYQLKLAGAAVDNKSALLEAALAFALDDLDRGVDSRILKQHIKPGIRRR
jgi:hypothetical protein